MDSDLKGLAQYINQLVDSNKPLNILEKDRDAEGAQLLAVPKTHEIYDLKEFLPKAPERIVTDIELNDIKSFIKYVNDFRGISTRIFGRFTGGKDEGEEDDSNCFKAIIDDHSKDVPGWCNHQVKLILKYSSEFSNWNRINGNMLNQDQFAEFLKDNRFDITDPVSSKIVELVMKLEISSQFSCVSKLPTNEGTVLNYEEKTQTAVNGQLITIPNKITLTIPMFYGMDPITIEAEFKLKVQNNKPCFGIRMIGIEKMELEALKNIAKAIKEQTSIDVLI